MQDKRGRKFHDFQEITPALQCFTAKSHEVSPEPAALQQNPSRPRGPELGYRASRVGEFKESDDWSPLLLLLRWALEQDSEGDAGDSCSRTLG